VHGFCKEAEAAPPSIGRADGVTYLFPSRPVAIEVAFRQKLEDCEPTPDSDMIRAVTAIRRHTSFTSANWPEL
jgi:hypothetical protein